MKFSVKNVEIDRFKGAEAGLFEELYANHEIVVSEQIFSIFFIPFFPVGYSYKVIRDYGVYEITPEAITRINAIKKYKSPWYNYFLTYILLIIIIVLGANLVFNRVSSYLNYTGNQNTSFEKSRQKNIEGLKNLKVGDFINFKEQLAYSEDITHMRVSEIKENVVQLVKIDTTFDLENGPNQLLIYFEKNKDKFLTYETSLDVLHKMNLASYEADNRGEGFDFFKNGELYVIKNIFTIELPCLTFALDDEKDSPDMKLNYIGEPITLKYIINVNTKDTIFLSNDSYSIDSSSIVQNIIIFGKDQEYLNSDKKYLPLATKNKNLEYYIKHYYNGKRYIEKINRRFMP